MRSAAALRQAAWMAAAEHALIEEEERLVENSRASMNPDDGDAPMKANEGV